MKQETPVYFSWWDLLRAIWYFLEGMRGKYVFWTITLFSVFFYRLIPPLLIGGIIDFFTKYKPGDSLTPFYTYVAILGIGHVVISQIRLTSKNKIAELGVESNYIARVKGFERLMDFSLTWHDDENTGNKVQRIQNGVTSLGNMRRLMSQHGFQTTAAILGVIGVFLFLNPVFSAFLLVYFVIFTAINISFYKKMLQVREEFNISQEKASGRYFEGLSNVLTIKTLGVKDTFKRNITSSEKISRDFNRQSIKIGITKWKVFQLINALFITVYLLMVGQNVAAGVISIGAIFVYYNYIMNLIEAAGDSTDVFEQLIEHKSAIGRMMPIYWEKHVIRNGTMQFPKNWKTITITDGVFSYKNADDQKESFGMEMLHFVVKRGEKIGIVGQSGGGKSTLAKLLMGLYKLEKGSFTVDDTDYYDIKHEEVTRQIAIVLQESEMFNLSLRENITLMRNVSNEVLEKAISTAQLSDLIEKLPEGLDTQIGEKGYRVSGGERQRIGIARAICKDPEILVLDEATSALDSKTESLIQHALEKDLKNKTVIIIAHRISTLRNVEKIYVFERGKIIEEGTFEELVKKHTSRFYELYTLQQKQLSET